MTLIALKGTNANIIQITPGDLVDNELVLDTDTKELYTYDSANTRLVSVSDYTYYFGHSATLAATNALRAIGLGSTINDNGYILHEDMLMTGLTLRRSDTDSSGVQIMIAGTTVKHTWNGLTTTNPRISGLAVAFSSGDLLWARVGAGENDMNIRCLTVIFKKRIAL